MKSFIIYSLFCHMILSLKLDFRAHMEAALQVRFGSSGVVADSMMPTDYHGMRNFSLGTNPNFKEIYLGRCFNVFDELPSLSSHPGSYECPRLYSLFVSSFLHKNDKDITPADFNDFFNDPVVGNSLKANNRKSLFWSGIRGYVDEFQKATSTFVMETSSIVGILTDLMFCGSSSSASGLDYDSCIYGDVNKQGVWHGTWSSFWAAASFYYAPFITGNVTIVMASYGHQDAYRRTSFFGSVELPHIDFPNIDFVHIMVAPASADAPLKAECETRGGSIQLLQKDLVMYGMRPNKILCTNRPRVVQHLLCANVAGQKDYAAYEHACVIKPFI